MSDPTHQLAAIMFTDIVGYTALMDSNEEKALAILEKNRSLLKPLILKHHGQWLKEIGDGTLSSFSSALEAVECAKEIQKSIEGDPDLKLRIGIHLGDVKFTGDDVFGEGVNIASRIEPLAVPGCICITDAVYNTIRNKPEVYADYLGEKSLKNVSRPVKIYQIRGRNHLKRTKFQLIPRTLSNHRKSLFAMLGLIGILMIGYFVIFDNDLFKPQAALDPASYQSIAILPFKYLGNNQEQSWIAQIMTEEVRRNVSQIPKVKVTSGLSSSIVYVQTASIISQKDEMGLKEISEKLGVRYLVEGSLQTTNEEAQLNVSLTDASTGKAIFMEKYNFRLDEIFGIQNEIAGHIAVKIRPTFQHILSFNTQKNINPNAYEKYMQGRYLWTFQLAKNREKIESLYLEAIEIDPDFSIGYAGLAELYLNNAHLGYVPHEVFPKSISNAKMSIKLDPNSYPALSALADCNYHYYYHWDLSERYFKKSLSIDPNYYASLLFYSGMLSALNRHEEAINQIRVSENIDPFNPFTLSWMVRTYYWARDFEAARNAFVEHFKRNPDSTYPWVWLDYAHLFPDSNQVEILKEQIINLPSHYTKVGLAIAYAENGNTEACKAIYNQIAPNLKKTAPSYLAKIDMHLGDYDKALAMLELAYELRDASVIWINADITFDPVRESPRFRALIRKMNLEEYPPY